MKNRVKTKKSSKTRSSSTAQILLVLLGFGLAAAFLSTKLLAGTERIVTLPLAEVSTQPIADGEAIEASADSVTTAIEPILFVMTPSPLVKMLADSEPKPAPKPAFEIVAPAPKPAVRPQPKKETPRQEPRIPVNFERETLDPEGGRTVEKFKDSLRVEKRTFNPEGRLLERWIFEEVSEGRIRGYEKFTYKEGALESYRITDWEYEPNGASVKTSRVYNAAGGETAFYLEFTAANGQKTCEQWFNVQGEMTSQKLWDAETGAFKQHVLIKPFLKDQKRVQWLNENKEKIKEVIVSADGRELPVSNALFGKRYETGFERLKTRDRNRQRELTLHASRWHRP